MLTVTHDDDIVELARILLHDHLHGLTGNTCFPVEHSDVREDERTTIGWHHQFEMTVEIGCRGDTLVAFQHHSGANDGLTILVDHRANDRGAVLCHDRESWADHHRA